MAKQFFNQEYTASRDGKNIKEGTRESRLFSRIVIVFFTFTILLSSGLVAFSIVFFYSPVKGQSMMLTLNAHYHDPDGTTKQDSVIVNRYATPKKGDIIVIKHYWNPKTDKTDWESADGEDVNGRYDYFIKRLIATEGDTLYFELKNPSNKYDCNIYLNGDLLDENDYVYVDSPRISNTPDMKDYLNNPDTCPYEEFIKEITYNDERGSRYEIVIPSGYFFFMGDNRKESHDCRSFGPQKTDLLVGTVADIKPSDQTLGNYVWEKFKYFVLFKWI